jgi:hypothetical protein
MKNLIATAISLVIAAWASAAEAPGLDGLLGHSSQVVVATLVRINPIAETTSDPRDQADIRITEVLKGTLHTGDTVQVNYQLSLVGSDAWKELNGPPDTNTQYIVFLRPKESTGGFVIVDYWLGVLPHSRRLAQDIQRRSKEK